MTLFELIHPIVSYMVSCRADAMAGKPIEHDVLLGHVMREFARIRKTGSVAPEIAPGLEAACTYTAFFIDYMVHESSFSFAREWQDLGRSQYNELAGDEKFFDYMHRWLDEDTPLAHDHLQLMYAMVASGFSGAYERRSVQLESLMRRTAELLKLKSEELATAELLSAKAKSAADRPSRQRPALPGIIATGAGLCLLGAAILFYIHAYTQATDRLHAILNSTQDFITTEARLHAHNSDSLIVSPFTINEQQPAPTETPQETDPQPSQE